MDVRSIVLTIVGVTIGIMLVCSLLLPQMEESIGGLSEGLQDEYGPLIRLTGIISIIGIVVAALYMFTTKN